MMSMMRIKYDLISSDDMILILIFMSILALIVNMILIVLIIINC